MTEKHLARGAGWTAGMLTTYLLAGLVSGGVVVFGFMLSYGLMISPFIAIGVVVLIVAEKRRRKLDAPVRFPRRSRKVA